MINAVQELNDNLQGIAEGVTAVTYWLDPRNDHKEIWNFLDTTIKSEETAWYMMGGTMVGIMLISIGAQWPKKVVFWGWVSYWLLRGIVFR